MIELPKGLTHPYERRGTEPAAAVFRHGMTFTWVRGDAYVSVQRGRVANALGMRVQVRDLYPGVPVLTGWVPLADWMPTPSSELWERADTMSKLADQWLATQHARMRRPA